MSTRVSLTVIYALALGAVVALDNLSGLPDVAFIGVWLLAPAVGFFVGRWWVVLAIAGAIFGRLIGWDPSDNDGNPALWAPYIASTIVLIGIPLLIGVGASMLRCGRQSRQPVGSSN